MKQQLIEARDLIAKGWTRGASARNAFGETGSPHSPQATCYCIFGALVKVYETPDQPWTAEVSEALAFIDLISKDHSPIGLNDREGTTQADMLDLLNRAIARCP